MLLIPLYQTWLNNSTYYFRIPRLFVFLLLSPASSHTWSVSIIKLVDFISVINNRGGASGVRHSICPYFCQYKPEYIFILVCFKYLKLSKVYCHWYNWYYISLFKLVGSNSLQYMAKIKYVIIIFTNKHKVSSTNTFLTLFYTLSTRHEVRGIFILLCHAY